MSLTNPYSVTVVIPAYKAQATIGRAVDSALQQEGCKVRVIVVVDGDLDATAQIIGEYSDPRVELVVNETNRGVQFSRNRGLSLVRDPFVMFLDSDDFLEGPMLASLASKMEADDADLGLGPMQTLLVAKARRGPTTVLNTNDREALFTGWLAEGQFVSPCSVLWRTAFLREIGGWDPELQRQEDGELVLRALMLGAKVVGATAGRGVYVIHDSPERLTQRSDNLISLLHVPAKLLGIETDVLSRDVVRRACAASYYNAAQTCFTRGRDDLGAEALRRARQLGLYGHRGHTAHKALSYTVGLRARCMMERAVRQALRKPGGQSPHSQDEAAVIRQGEPRITVVIPSYKAEKTIERAIDSVLAQQHCTTRVVVVVDGDLDSTARILADRADPRVTVLVNHENRGVQYSRGRGLDAAEDEFVMFLDSDDFIEGPLLADLAARMNAAGADLGLGPMQTLLESRGKRGSIINPSYFTVQDLFTAWLVDGRFIGTCSVLWRTSFLRRIGGWDPDLKRQEDGELVLRAILLGAKVARTKTGRGVYVIHNSPDRLTQRSDNLDSLLKVPSKLLNLESRVISPEVVRWACAGSYYNAARVCFTRGQDEIGLEALRQSRQLGFRGHVGSAAHKLLSRTLGLRLRCRLERTLRKIVENSPGSGLLPALRTPKAGVLSLSEKAPLRGPDTSESMAELESRSM